MISIKKHLLMLFCLLTTLTNCATTTTTYPEAEGYTTPVSIFNYFQEIEKTVSYKIPDTITFNKTDLGFNFTDPTPEYNKDIQKHNYLKIDYLEFTTEDRTSVISNITDRQKNIMDGMMGVDPYEHMNIGVGETGYMFICFKDPKNNKKSYIKLHLMRVKD